MDTAFGNAFNGMRVIESPYATVSTPVRTHKLTRSQLKHLEKHMFKGITYHDRIQKKWNKRFGFKQVPGCFIIDHSKIEFGYDNGEKVIVAHPSVVKALKEHKESDSKTGPVDYLQDKYDKYKRHSEEVKRNIDIQLGKWNYHGLTASNSNGVLLDIGA